VYFAFAIFSYLLALAVGAKNNFKADLILTCSLAFVLTGMFTNEILCHLSANLKLQVKIYKELRVCDLLSLLISLALVLWYSLAGQAWYTSDFLALSIVGASLKLFKVTSFRDGAILLVLCTIYDIIYYIFVNVYITSENYQ
jgi:hypothetical protein